MSTTQRLLLLLIGLTAADAARADTEVCIENTTALYEAFAAVNGGNTGTILFKLRSGTYSLGADLVMGYRAEDGDPNRSHGTVTIRGGYNSGCTTQSASLGGTLINAASGNPNIDIELNNNSLLFDTISTRDVDLVISNWICYTHHYAEGNQVTIKQSRLENARVVQSSNCHGTAIRNSMITSRSGNPNDQAIIVSPYADEELLTPSVTIVGSTIRSGVLRINVESDSGDPPRSLIKIQNTVFENDGAEISVDGGNVYAIRNRYDSINIANGGLMQDANNLSVPPQLGSNGVPSNASPLVNEGSRFVDGGLPVLDLAANPREIGTNPDIGAFETNVNNTLYLDVTTTASSGAGSLAQAVASANAFNGGQVIRFDIPGSCPRIITLTSTLNVTDDLRILGDTQSGTVKNSLDFGAYNGAPCVVLRAGSGVDDAIEFDSAETGDNLQLTHLAFSGFTSDAVTIESGSGHRLSGLHFGASIGGTALDDVGFAIRLSGDAADADIGGTDPELVNFIGSTSVALQLGGLGGHQVIGNAIGSRGLDDFGNTIGIIVSSPSNRINANRIVLSSAPNVLLSGPNATDNALVGNTISSGGSHGISITNGANTNRIGPDNSIIGNQLDGVAISAGARNQIRENRFGSNGELGIDLGPDGVTENDIDPTIVGLTTSANRLQNFPTLNTLRRVPFFSQIFASLDGELETTEGSYAIDVFRVASCDASGHGEGNVLIGSTTVVVDCGLGSHCAEPFELLLADSGFDDGDHIAMTVTGPFGNTSEFSPCYDQNPDLAVSVTNNTNGVQTGAATTYTIVARNEGHSTVGTERVRDTFPAACANVIWTCTGQNGGTCSPSGTGNINDAVVTLPIGGQVTYLATCYISPGATGTLVNTATISSSRDDLTPADNTDTDTDTITSVTLAIASASISEGTGGNTTMAFTVTATPTPVVDTTVDYATANGSATAPGDYSARAGTLTFAAGQATRTINVPIITDSVVEGDETFTVTLDDAVGAMITTAVATGTILNDDAHATTTSISSHTPNPSQPGESYTVTVVVRTSSVVPEGTVSVSEGQASCVLTLVPVSSVASRGSCALSSVVPGDRTLTATYIPGNATFAPSSDTDTHQVSFPALLSDGFEQ